MEPIERPYCYLLLVTCYLLLVTVGGGVFGRQIMWNDLIVTCYLLLVTIGGGVFGRQIMWNDLIVICYLLFWEVVFLGEQTCVTTLLLVVSC